MNDANIHIIKDDIAHNNESQEIMEALKEMLEMILIFLQR